MTSAYDIPSPCTKICQIDRRTGWCLGCLRSGEEIGAWPRMGLDERLALLRTLDERRRQQRAAG
ncbi:DUF1289 domain-containing protein [Ferrovibrio xuzhouensis]|uniref:DUF1289 domain-containing protein n=1 Tax=Ferrovibrio xuzhouensis TaxID=1576914 RepID=A0ABV7VC79_9PROT